VTRLRAASAGQARDRAASAGPAGFWTAVGRVFPLALGQMIWSKRTMFIALIVGVPVLLAVFARAGGAASVSVTINGGRVGAEDMVDTIVWLLFLRFAVPVLGVWYGTSLIADEVDEKTITYLFVRPIRRGAVVIGKYLAYLACTCCIVLAAVGLVLVSVMGATARSPEAGLWGVLVALMVGLASYGALFTFMGASLKRPLVVGLIFAFGWEQVALLVPGYLRRFTLAYHLESVFRESSSAATSLVWLLAITAGCLLLATRAVERREYVLDQ
jgi:ABC-type transport system involved in multi-copper enzyme maturation permease subunit